MTADAASRRIRASLRKTLRLWSTTALAARPDKPAPAPPVPTYDLKLGSWKCYSQYGFQEIDGQVKNISDRRLDFSLNQTEISSNSPLVRGTFSTNVR